MEKEFLMQLDECLQDEMFLQRYREYAKKSLGSKNMFLTKILNFLISTRDFKNVGYYIENFSLSYVDCDYKRCFPYDYLKFKGLSKEESEKTIYDNFIRNGFLFHITPDTNLNEILQNGLQTLNDRTKRNMYDETLRVNRVYEKIKKRNSGMFTMSTLISIPGGDIYLNEERFDSIYLSSNLDYALKTYGLSSEISTLFVRDFFWAFKNKVPYEKMDKEEIRTNIIETLESHPGQIYDDEIECIVGYFNRIYHDKEDLRSQTNQSIIMVPTQSINTDDKSFNILYRDGTLKYAPEVIIDFNNGEVTNKGSISTDNLIALNPTREKILTLKKSNN